MTDLSVLDVPEDFLVQVPRTSRHQVLSQGIQVNLEWWHQALKLRGLPGCVGGMSARSGGTSARTGQSWLTRSAVFELAADADTDGDRALTLLWHALAWGAGTSARNMNRRLDAIAADPDAAASALVCAAAAGPVDVNAAYEALRPGGRNLLHYLGPAFFSKYLYFAGGGDPNHPCLILDARVATALKARGWESLRTGGAWPAHTYRRYCELLARWAQQASTDERRVAPDELELWLFRQGKPAV